MPELPEVETNMRNFRVWARGRRIVRVVPPPGTRETGGMPPVELRKRLEGRGVEEVTRRGKWILAALSGGAGLVLHLGMTGKIARVSANAELPRFTRAAFHLDGGGTVCFVDSRRFGKVLAGDFADLREEIERELGPDALEIDLATFREAISRTKRTIKETIMDQRVIAGVGNLYATEALWRAKIHPGTPAAKVTGARAAALLEGIKDSLLHGLKEYEGVELPEYIEEGGENPFFAYDRAGEPCPRCGARLKAETIGGRTSAYCPKCQKRRQ